MTSDSGDSSVEQTSGTTDGATSRLGPWLPSSMEERLDRMESLADIRQLAVRYALAVDSRDMDTLVGLFAPDVRVGRDRSGRPALRDWFVTALHAPRTSVHLVANHIIDFDDADHARGIVYCQDELEQPTTGEWQTGKLQYWDSYVRAGGLWCFARRRFHRWYIVDALERPAHGAGVKAAGAPLHTELLPDAFPTWAAFWA